MFLLLLSKKFSGLPTGPIYRAQPDDMHVFVAGQRIYVTYRMDSVTFSLKRK